MEERRQNKGRSSSYRRTDVASKEYLELAASDFLIRGVVDNLLSAL